MKNNSKSLTLFLAGIFVLALAPQASAQIQTTGTPGTAGATTTISGK